MVLPPRADHDVAAAVDLEGHVVVTGVGELDRHAFDPVDHGTLVRDRGATDAEAAVAGALDGRDGLAAGGHLDGVRGVLVDRHEHRGAPTGADHDVAATVDLEGGVVVTVVGQGDRDALDATQRGALVFEGGGRLGGTAVRHRPVDRRAGDVGAEGDHVDGVAAVLVDGDEHRLGVVRAHDDVADALDVEGHALVAGVEERDLDALDVVGDGALVGQLGRRLGRQAVTGAGDRRARDVLAADLDVDRVGRVLGDGDEHGGLGAGADRHAAHALDVEGDALRAGVLQEDRDARGAGLVGGALVGELGRRVRGEAVTGAGDRRARDGVATDGDGHGVGGVLGDGHEHRRVVARADHDVADAGDVEGGGGPTGVLEQDGDAGCAVLGGALVGQLGRRLGRRLALAALELDLLGGGAGGGGVAVPPGRPRRRPHACRARCHRRRAGGSRRPRTTGRRARRRTAPTRAGRERTSTSWSAAAGAKSMVPVKFGAAEPLKMPTPAIGVSEASS